MNNINKILIAVDDGSTAETVAKSGLALAQQLNAEIALVSVVDNTALMSEGNFTPGELTVHSTEVFKSEHQLLIEKTFKGVAVTSYIEEGVPHEGILKVAKAWNADLIVLGTHGRKGIAHIIMGSVAEKVVRYSTAPVFIIPIKE